MARLTVLCVDDDPAVLDLLTASAEDTDDFGVVAVASGATGVLDLVRRHEPDVVVVDLGLGDDGAVVDLRDGGPGHRAHVGLELVELVRRARSDATIVVFTGWHGMEAAARTAGADAVVEKPDIDAIWHAVRRVRSSAKR